MNADSTTLALAGGSLLVAVHVRTETKDRKRRNKMARVIELKEKELAAVAGEGRNPLEVLDTAAQEWDVTTRRHLLVDLTFADPFAPYSLKYDQDDVIAAVRRIATRIGEPATVVDEIVKAKKVALRSHRVRSLARIGVLTLAAGAAFATAGWALAPAIGAAIGGGAGLAGAAATAHGLALLGGGSLAAGGAGMAGGMWLVTGAGAALGVGLGGASSLAYQLGVSDVRAELVKLQVSFRVAVLLTQADAGEAAKVVEGLRQTRDDLDKQLELERRLNDENSARLQDLQEKVKLMTETINWMDEEIMEHGDEPALLD
jgi:hypothetical protein